MRITTLLVITVLLSMSLSAQVVFSDNFTGTQGDSLSNLGWTVSSGGTTNAQLINGAGLTLAQYPGSGVGNAVTMANTGQDVYKTFDSLTSGNVYLSFMLDVATATATGDYFMALSTKSSPSFYLASRIFIKASGSGYVLGISKTSSDASTYPEYGTTELAFGTTYGVVVKYTIAAGDSNDVIDVFAVSGTFPTTEPGTAEIAGHNGSLKGDASDIGSISLRQGGSSSGATQTVDGILITSEWPVAANVTFRLNTSTVSDTTQSTTNVQVRGGTPPLTWGDDSPKMMHDGGDYWTVTHTFIAGQSVEYKYFVTGAANGGWETTNNHMMTVNGDTTLPYEYWSSATPPYQETDSIDVWFRVNMQSQESFNPASDEVDVRGSFNGWAAGTPLTREGATRFYSGQAKIPDTAGVGSIEYKFTYTKNGTTNWENVSNRTANVTVDTTIYWVWWDNVQYNPPVVSDTVIVTFTANMSRAIAERGFAFGDTLLVRSGYNSTAAEVREKRLSRVGLTTLYSVVDTVVAAIGKTLNYQYYLIKNASDFREVYFDFGFEDPTNPAAERRRVSVSANAVSALDTSTSNTESRRVPRFRNTLNLSQAVAVTYTADVRPAIYALLAGKSLVATNIAPSVLSDADSILSYGVFMNGPAVGGWDVLGRWGDKADTVKMYDDGTHGDAVAGDSVFSLTWNYTTSDVIGQEFKFGIGSYDNEGGFGNNHIENIDDSGPTTTIASQFGSIDPIFFDMWDFDKMEPKVVTSVNDGQNVPEVYSLEQNYPNPFNPATIISFGLPQESDVALKVFNMLGQEIATIANGRMKAGVHEVTFDATRLATGIYFYQIKAGDFTSLKKMVLVK